MARAGQAVLWAFGKHRAAMCAAFSCNCESESADRPAVAEARWHDKACVMVVVVGRRTGPA